MLAHGTTLNILVAEDDLDDQFFIDYGFKKNGRHEVMYVNDGLHLMDHLAKANADIPTQPKLPDLILMDLNMPCKSGREAIVEIKSSERFKHIPVVVLTTSTLPADVKWCYQHFVAGYLVKPVTLEGLSEMIESLEGYWAKTVKLPYL